MAYQIKFTDLKRFPADVINVSDSFFNGPVNPSNPAYYTALTGSANNASTTLTLSGRGVVDYGMPIQQGLIYMLEHFANYRSPVYPQPGQVWYKPRARDLTPGNEEAEVVTDPTALGLYIYRGADTPGGPKPDIWDPIPVSGYMHQAFDMSNGSGTRYRITGLADAVGLYDAVSQSYGDARYINAVGSDTKDGTLTLIGGTSQVVLPNAPLIGTNATNKTYVDTTIALEIASNNVTLAGTYLPLTGGTLTGPLDLPFDDVTLGIGTLTLTSGSISLPSGGSINVAVGDVTISAGDLNAGGASNFTGLATFTNGLTLSSTLMTVANTQILLTGASTITGVPLPGLPTDAASKAYVDAVAGSLGADGVVISGNVNALTGVITLNRTIGADVVLSGAAAPFAHTHQSTEVFHDANPPQLSSFVREQFIDQVIWPSGVSLQAVLNLFDDALSETTRPYSRSIVISDGVTDRYELDRPIPAGFNQLQVFVDGVKWIASQYAEGVFQQTPELRRSDDTGLLNATPYAFNLTIDGVLYPSVTITTPAGPDFVSFYHVQTLIDAQLIALAIPAVCVFVGNQIRILSALPGAGSSVAFAPPSVGTNLFTSITTSTVVPLNDSILTTYTYYEDALPHQEAEEFVFTTIPPLGATIEIITLTR